MHQTPTHSSPPPLSSLLYTRITCQEKQTPIVQAVLALRDDSDIGDTKAKIEVLRKGCCHPQVRWSL